MSATRRINEDVTPTGSYQLTAVGLEDGSLVLYDKDGDDAWLQTTPNNAIELDGRWR